MVHGVRAIGCGRQWQHHRQGIETPRALRQQRAHSQAGSELKVATPRDQVMPVGDLHDLTYVCRQIGWSRSLAALGARLLPSVVTMIEVKCKKSDRQAHAEGLFVAPPRSHPPIRYPASQAVCTHS